VVQLYAGAFFPGLMLAGLYVGYVMLRAKLNPALAPPPPPEERVVPMPEWTARLSGSPTRRAIPALLAGLRSGATGVPRGKLAGQLALALLPAFMVLAPVALLYQVGTTVEVVDTGGMQEIGTVLEAEAREKSAEGLAEPPQAGLQEPPGAEKAPAPAESPPTAPPKAAAPPQGWERPAAQRVPAPTWFWVVAVVGALILAVNYYLFSLERFQVFKLLLGSFFPLSALILSVLGTIIFGWATPTEAAAMGAAGGLILAAAYRKLTFNVVKESAFLTAKTTAMVCWLFVGSSIFSASFALLGGQEIIERWVLSLNMTPVQFMLLAQFIIFILGWPLEWTEIIVIFMPIFLPLLGHFQVDPLFFGLLVAINLQTAFLSPPVAMAAFYLKGVAPPHVTLNQIFAGMMPFMVIQVIALALLYLFPGIGLWLPSVLYK
jgi:TRAP-type mannitol/chloroaromatic compound transport system permease large subunit